MRLRLHPGDLMLTTNRYFIDEHEYRFSHCSDSNIYHFDPIPDNRRKARKSFSTSQLCKRVEVEIPEPTEQLVEENGQLKLVTIEEVKSIAQSQQLSVIKRQDGDIQIYSAVVPWQFVANFFMFADTELPPEERAQRGVTVAHANKLKKYLLSDDQHYLPPMIVSLEMEGKSDFKQYESDFPNGVLTLPLTCSFNIIDGQHRTYAIREILQGKDATKFKGRLMSVDLIINPSLALKQKIFREVNSLGKSVSRNLTTVYLDTPIAIFANSVLSTIPLFDYKFVEKEKNSLNKKSPKLLVYKHLYDATVLMKPGLSEDADFKFCQTFWLELSDIIRPWMQVLDGEITPIEVRESTVAAHGVTIHALGELGNYWGRMYAVKPDLGLLKSTLHKLKSIDWAKSNPHFLHRVVDEQGGMLANRRNVKLMLNYFKAVSGVLSKHLIPADKELEINYIGSLKIFEE